MPKRLTTSLVLRIEHHLSAYLLFPSQPPLWSFTPKMPSRRPRSPACFIFRSSYRITTPPHHHRRGSPSLLSLIQSNIASEYFLHHRHVVIILLLRPFITLTESSCRLTRFLSLDLLRPSQASLLFGFSGTRFTSSCIIHNLHTTPHFNMISFRKDLTRVFLDIP